jgi:hypothetical protein
MLRLEQFQRDTKLRVARKLSEKRSEYEGRQNAVVRAVASARDSFAHLTV